MHAIVKVETCCELKWPRTGYTRYWYLRVTARYSDDTALSLRQELSLEEMEMRGGPAVVLPDFIAQCDIATMRARTDKAERDANRDRHNRGHVLPVDRE